jgi:hypothetical protein
MLRCRENDLAVVLVGAYTGYMVTVGKFMGTVNGVDPFGFPGTSHDCWEVKGPGISIPGTQVIACEDKRLQPIRPGRTPVTTETERRITA